MLQWWAVRLHGYWLWVRYVLAATVGDALVPGPFVGVGRILGSRVGARGAVCRGVRDHRYARCVHLETATAV